MRALASVLTALFLAGCYVNVPIGSTVPDRGTTLAVRLTDSGADTLARLIGPSVTTVQGNLVGGGNDSLVLAVRSVQLRSGTEQFWKGEQVTIPRGMIAIVSERKLSRWRTALLTGLAMAGSIALVASTNNGGIEGRPGGGGPGQTQ